jgi:hypothetical protein
MTESARRRYVRRRDRPVVAVRLAFKTDGLVYWKWGGEQQAKAGDWIVDNDGDVYTVAANEFARTYRRTGPGTYVKTTPIWAERAPRAGRLTTNEGSTSYVAGDYLVSNTKRGTHVYAIRPSKFKSLYELDDRQ